MLGVSCTLNDASYSNTWNESLSSQIFREAIIDGTDGCKWVQLPEPGSCPS